MEITHELPYLVIKVFRDPSINQLAARTEACFRTHDYADFFVRECEDVESGSATAFIIHDTRPRIRHELINTD